MRIAPEFSVPFLSGDCLLLNTFDFLLTRASGNTANVLSLDVPSGISCDTGDFYDVERRIVAKWTVSFGLPKVGLHVCPRRPALPHSVTWLGSRLEFAHSP